MKSYNSKFRIFLLSFQVISVYREHKDSMVRLRKLLTDSAKAKRHRRKILNVQVTFLAWLVESVGFLVIFLGTFILGHESNTFNFFMQTLTLTIYFNILPCMFLMNDSDIKSIIVTSNFYDTLLTIFHCNYVKSIDIDEENSSSSNPSEEENPHREENVIAGEDNCNNDNRHSPLFKRSFEEAQKEDTTGSRNEHENNNDVQDEMPSPSSSTDVVVIDLELVDNKT